MEAVRAGSIAMLQDELKRSINEAYVQMEQTNHLLNGMVSQTHPSMLYELSQQVGASVKKARPSTQKAKQELLNFLSSES